MSFQLLINNLTSANAVIDYPGGVLATDANFTTLYDYATQYMPELVPDLYFAYGRGNITQFLKAVAKRDTYASDYVQWAEQGRLHGILKNVTFVGSTFTSPVATNLRVGDRIKISNGIDPEAQATVSSITSATVFVVTNDSTVAFPTGPVEIIPFSNSFRQGTDPFANGFNWNPSMKQNYTQIVKETYTVPNSKMTQKIWLTTPSGPVWANLEIDNTRLLFNNKVEMTHTFHNRVEAGSATATANTTELGMRSIIEQVERGGNIANEYIQTIDDLDEIALRLLEQGGVKEVTVWCDFEQMRLFNNMMANVNAGYFGGSNYGLFQNSADMALKLGFRSVERSGVTFNFTLWNILNDPTLFGGANFRKTGVGFLIVPAGNTMVTENGMSVDRPFLCVRDRSYDGYNRGQVIEIFGPEGTKQKADKTDVIFLAEQTNQVVGANKFIVGRAGDIYS